MFSNAFSLSADGSMAVIRFRSADGIPMISGEASYLQPSITQSFCRVFSKSDWAVKIAASAFCKFSWAVSRSICVAMPLFILSATES